MSGAASGIGAAVAERLEQEGATVVRSDLVETEGGVGVRRQRSAPVRRRRAQPCSTAHGALHVLANVAGIGFSRRIGEVTPEEWRRVIDVNLTGTFLLSQAALPVLLEARGVIVNMASVAGLRATPYNAAYCASKGGVIMLTKSMALELARQGVRVNAVCPASVDTPFLRGFELPEGADMALALPVGVAHGSSDRRRGGGGRGGLPGVRRRRHHQRHDPRHRRCRDRLTSERVTVSVSWPERRTRPGRSSVTAPSVITSRPPTKTWAMPREAAHSRSPPPGRSRQHLGGPAAHLPWIEDHQVGEPARRDPRRGGPVRSAGRADRSSSRRPARGRAGPAGGPPHPARPSGSWHGT